MDEFTLTLNSPIAEEQWDMITDVDFDRTNEVTFHTKHGKQVVFVKRENVKGCETCMRQGCAYMDGSVRVNCPLWKESAV